VAEEVPDEVDRLACVEEMDGRRMTQHVNVPARDGQGSLRCVMAKEHLNSADFQTPLMAEEERGAVVSPALEIPAKERKQVSADRPLA